MGKKAGLKRLSQKKNAIESVAIIGAGPAGLAAADRLRKMGIQVTVYDRYDRAGGLLTYGIPGFKLEKDVVMRRNSLLSEGGVNFELNTNIGIDISFNDIRSKHDAVLIGTGVYKARELSGIGSSNNGIVKALDYLTASNRSNMGDYVPEIDSGELNAEGKRVVVIGGGDTAMGLCQNSNSPRCKDLLNVFTDVIRKICQDHNAKLKMLRKEGVEFVWLSATKRFCG